MYDTSWERWLYDAINHIPHGVSAGEAVKMEEALRELVRRIETTGL